MIFRDLPLKTKSVSTHPIIELSTIIQNSNLLTCVIERHGKQFIFSCAAFFPVD